MRQLRFMFLLDLLSFEQENGNAVSIVTNFPYHKTYEVKLSPLD